MVHNGSIWPLGSSWLITIHNSPYWYLLVHHGPSVSTRVQQAYHGPSWAITSWIVRNFSYKSIIVLDDLSWPIMVHFDRLLCIMVNNVRSWSILDNHIHNGPSWPIMVQYCPKLSFMFHHGPSWSNKTRWTNMVNHDPSRSLVVYKDQ